MESRKIRIRAFSYFREVEDEATGQDVIRPMVAQRGETVELTEAEIKKGERLNAFVVESDESDDDAPNEVDDDFVELAGEDELIAFVESRNAPQVVAAADGDAEKAKRLLEAEKASEGEDRKTVVEGLGAVISASNQ